MDESDLAADYFAAIPGVKVKNYNIPDTSSDPLGQTYGYVDILKSPKIINYNTANAGIVPKAHTLGHEAEHLLAGARNEPPGMLNKTWDDLMGSDTPFSDREALVKRIIKATPYLQNKYGFPVDANFTQDYFDKVHSDTGGRGRNLLYEQLASLSSFENLKKIDLMNDLYLREHVFQTPAERETYKATTGLRQTRLDSKDLPPYTRVTEAPQAPIKPKEQPTFLRNIIDYLKKR